MTITAKNIKEGDTYVTRNGTSVVKRRVIHRAKISLFGVPAVQLHCSDLTSPVLAACA